MNQLISWWARNPVAANLLMIGLFITGILGFMKMEREVIPDIGLGLIEVNVLWPGASPQEVEEQLVVRIEEALKDVDHITQLNSTAREGFGQVLIKAGPSADMGQFINNIKLKIDSISNFPRNIEPPVVSEVFARSELIQVAVHGEVSERNLARIAEELRNEIALLPGVSIVEVAGARREEVSIELSAQAIREYNLSISELSNAIRASSINFSSGRIRTNMGEFQLRGKNFAQNQSDFEDIIVRQGERGGIIRVGDVAKVVDGFEEDQLIGEFNGQKAVLIKVLSSEKTDIVKISQSVNKWLVEAKKRQPEGVNLTLWWDSSEIYKDRMSTLGNSAFYGLLLVFVVLFLSLRPKIALWVTLGIATAYAGSFALLPANDVSINILSTFAFLLVLGIVVDDAIVIGESIHDQSDSDGSGNVENAILGTQLVAKPVLYAVLTTMIVFMPWFFLSGQDAQITRHISIVIVLALAFSIIEAFFILPAHLSQLEPIDSNNSLVRIQRRISQSIVDFANNQYRRLLQTVVRNNLLTLSIFTTLFIISIGFLTSGWVKFSFLPAIESDRITVSINLVNGTPEYRALDVLNQVKRAQKQLVLAVEAGQGKDAQLVQNWYSSLNGSKINVILKLVTPGNRSMSAKEASAQLRQFIGNIPDAQEVLVSYNNNNAPGLEYAVSHSDLDVLKTAVNELKNKLNSYQDLEDVRDNLQSSATEELHFRLLPGAERMGLNLSNILQEVRSAYYGEEVQRIARNGKDVKVMVRYPLDDRNSLESLANFRFLTKDNKEVPLNAVTQIEYRPGVKSIERRERQRTALISAEVNGDAMTEIQSDLQKVFLPEWLAKYPGLSLGEVGSAESQKAFITEILGLYAIAFFLMYALISVAFRSYTKPLVVMVAIPFGFMGAVYGHYLYGVPMALFSYFGIGAAAGVVVNDNLVLLDYINRLQEKGALAREAVIEASVKRFRPIVLTSVTTFVGLIPMMADRSVQAQFLQPAVVSLAFGVLVAAAVTLLLVPAIYVIGPDLRSALTKTSGKFRSDQSRPIDNATVMNEVTNVSNN
jgi:multidrug efflux pump subunit AcrB